MSEWLSIKAWARKKPRVFVEEEVRRRIADKKARGLLTDKDVDEMVDMRLKPLADIQDVQSVYENTLFDPKK